MTTDTTVVVDTTTDAVEKPVTPPEGETAEQQLARLEETNKKLYERAKDAEAKAKEYKAKIPLPTPEKPKIEDDVVSDVKELKQIEKKRQFGYRNSLSPEETDLLFKMTGDSDPSEVLKGDDFKDLLEVRRRRARVANAIPSGTNRTISIEGKKFKDMTTAERAANWSKIVKK
jgi:hypothetical protein